jgi:hypothetical protein
MADTGCAKPSGRNVRLNVEARSGTDVAGKFLVCIDEEASIKDLISRIQGSLGKHGIEGAVVKLTNAQEATIPGEEGVRDVLRDGEEIVAMLGFGGGGGAWRAPAAPATVAAPKAGAAVPMMAVPVLARASPPAPPQRAGPQVKAQDDDVVVGFVNVPAPEAYDDLPAPVEVFEEDVKDQALAHQTGWEVEGLTPKLREYISTRFTDVRAGSADPSQAFIMVTMRPQQPPALPIHYSVARIDIIEFERLCGRKVLEVRDRLAYFNGCREKLTSLLESGACRYEYAPNTLPYQYRGDEEFESVLAEVDEGTFGQPESFRPVFIVDTSGAVGESLGFVRAALKRMLYSMIVAKSKFNLIGFGAQGRTVIFERGMVQPTAQRLRRAEEWLDELRPIRGPTDFLGGLQCALATQEADSIYLLSAGIPHRGNVEYILKDIRSRNVRQLPIHVVGVDCDEQGGLALQRIAEQNQGSFRHKCFNGIDPNIAARPPRPPPQPPTNGDSEDARLTIGGQVDILDIMSNEHTIQQNDWLEEQKCANRLLLTTTSQSAVLSHDDMRELKRQAQADSDRLHAAASASARSFRAHVTSNPPALSSAPGSAASAACQPRAGSVPPGLDYPRPGSRGPPLQPLVVGPPVVGSAGCGLRQSLRGREGSCKRAPLTNPWDRPRPVRGAGLRRPGSARRARLA